LFVLFLSVDVARMVDLGAAAAATVEALTVAATAPFDTTAAGATEDAVGLDGVVRV
jgi:hypothetical protein